MRCMRPALSTTLDLSPVHEDKGPRCIAGSKGSCHCWLSANHTIGANDPRATPPAPSKAKLWDHLDRHGEGGWEETAMDSERLGRALLQMKFPAHRDQIADHSWPAFALLCEAYGMATGMRDELRRCAATDPGLLLEFETVCIELETDAAQLLSGGHAVSRR